MKLWTGRFQGKLNETAAKLNDSLSFDYRLAFADVKGSAAWVKALAAAGVLPEADKDLILQGLEQIRADFEQDQFAFQPGDEDIHTAVERSLTERVGPAGARLHTGRSRNDQVATDFRLWLVEKEDQLAGLLKDLQAVLVARAEADFGAVLPGYTHFQQAQPILLSHWWLAHFWALQRDQEKLAFIMEQTRVMPLGCGALAGTAFPIDRFALAEDLGFEKPCANSLDAVSDRDFAADFLFWAEMVSVHLSRMAEALILYSTSEYGFIKFSDEYSTGSSLMPQKKNPDPMELTRAKCGVITGKLTGFLSVLKALPSAYDKDLQEDKPAVFETAELLEVLIPVVAGAISTLTILPERMRAAIQPAVLATDLADYLVKKGVPFREAHSAVGKAVAKAEVAGISLMKMPLADWTEIHPQFSDDLYSVFDIDKSLEARSAYGGTAPQVVRAAIQQAKGLL